MLWFRNLRIYSKICAVLILATIFFIGVGWTGYYYMNEMHDSVKAFDHNHADSEKMSTLKDGVERQFSHAINVLMGISVLAIILCAVSGIYVARLIIKPIKHLEALMVEVGQGNLAVRDSEQFKDEIGDLINVFNDMVSQQSRLVGVVQKTAVELTAASEEMAASTEEVTATTGEVARSVESLAQEADTGDRSVVEASKALLELSSLVQIAKNQAESAAESSKITAQAADEGKRTLEETTKRMANIKSKAAETEQLIDTLGQYSAQIGIITDTITSLAGQTNLLALNAAIEAARAGEAGRGFAVVAEEVRKLAEQSNQGAEQVAQLVQKIAESTSGAVKAVRQSRDEVERGVEVVSTADQALDSILSAVDKTVDNVKSVTEVASEEVATSEKIVALINELATVIENTDNHAKEVAASVQETLSAMETVAGSAEEASAMAAELKDEVAMFKIGKE